MVGSEARLLRIFYLRSGGGLDIWKEEVRTHHLGRVGGNEISEVGQDIFTKGNNFGKWLDKVPDGLVSGWSAPEKWNACVCVCVWCTCRERKRVVLTCLVLYYKAVHNILLFEENHENYKQNSAKKKIKNMLQNLKWWCVTYNYGYFRYIIPFCIDTIVFTISTQSENQN